MRTILPTFFFMLPAIAYAEVMDKEFSLITVLLWGIVSAILVFLSARLKPILLLALLPVIGLFFFAHLSELIDPSVGPAIAAESGQFYVFISWSTPVLVFISVVLGFIFRSRDVKFNT